MAAQLPIAAHREALVALVQQVRCAVVVGDTGSGKTTQLPQYLLAAGLAGGRPIAVTQPRRVAAISVAERVSQELGTELGDQVGYQGTPPVCLRTFLFPAFLFTPFSLNVFLVFAPSRRLV